MEFPADELPSIDGTVLDPLPEGVVFEDSVDPAGEAAGDAALQRLIGGV